MLYEVITILNLKKIIKPIIIFLLILFCVLLLVFSKEVSKSIINSISLCLNVIIPSLFGFMVISNILIKSNIYIYMSRPFYLISKYLFRIPPELFSVFFVITSYSIHYTKLYDKRYCSVIIESFFCV